MKRPRKVFHKRSHLSKADEEVLWRASRVIDREPEEQAAQLELEERLQGLFQAEQAAVLHRGSKRLESSLERRHTRNPCVCTVVFSSLSASPAKCLPAGAAIA